MARVRRYLNVTNGWEQSAAAATANAADLPHLEVPVAKLTSRLGDARSLIAEQSALTASKQEATKRLHQILREGEALADLVRTAAREHYGTRSEKLVEFGMQPFRGRNRKKKPQEPESPPAPAAETTGSTPAPETAK